MPTSQILGATKWCVFKSINPSRSVVQAAVQERMERMRSKHVDLLQVRNNPIRHIHMLRNRISFTGKIIQIKDIWLR
jgi:hypothetical protein